ncbi:MAG: menaquinone biosynthesis decarboxylase [Ignavibacteriales bacterium]|nr:menaquinone biosynthesis decarboxylase [Ignavibacteriales bacterium]
MTFPALGEFVRYLESIHELHRVTVEVDPYLEITEIATRALKEGKPALLFENVKGSTVPLVINAFASERRIEHALGRHPQQIGEELISFIERVMPPKLATLWENKAMLKRFVSAKAKHVSSGFSQEVVSEPNFDALPIQTCWPNDGGRFFTLGQVFTYDPVDGKRNVGMYRLHVYNSKTTGMHWQIQKGGGFHYHRAEQLGEDLEVAVALGTDPALLLATVAALPEGIDEVLFAAFLRGASIPMAKGKSISVAVPAQAEFVLEGIVPRKERRMEGPFGDHFGHYSSAAKFPVFHVKKITHRRNPIYPATVVGIPPMEDKFLGDATQQILGPLARLIHKEVKDVWAYYEAGFHNLLVVSIEERYKKEAMKAALGLLGTGQLSLTKCLILVSPNVDVRYWKSVLGEIRDHFDPHFDFVLLPKVPLDTLDFTSYTMELGSKMILDATRKQRLRDESKISKRGSKPIFHIPDLKSLDRRIVDARAIEDCLLLVKVKKDGRQVVEKLVGKKELQHFKMIAAVSEDVNIHDQENYIWGVFTRFDCERDVVFTEQKLIGISPVYKGVMGIDATWKKGYPDPLTMPDKIIKKVDQRWESYWV